MHDIRVNTIHPGAVNTPIVSGDMQDALQRAEETNPTLNNMGPVRVAVGSRTGGGREPRAAPRL